MSAAIPIWREAMLIAYLDGDLCLQDAAELEQSLTTDAALASALHMLVRADELLRVLGRSSEANATASATSLLLLLRMLPSMGHASAHRPPASGLPAARLG